MARILVADDVSENRYLLVSLLAGHGHEVVAVTNGAEALAQAQKSPPDLVVTDVLMPIVDGFELCRRWKKDERLKRVPFVIYTATYTDPKDERLASALGADRFLVKPQQPDVLLRVVNEVLEEVARDPAAVRPGPDADAEVLLEHNEALTRKLEKKVFQLEAEVSRCVRVESALRESERRFRLLAENSLDVVWSMGFDGRLTYVSPAVETLQGFSPGEAMRLPPDQVFGDEGLKVLREGMAPLLADVSAGKTSDRIGLFEIEQPCKDGSTVWTEVSAAIMRDEYGTAVGIQGVTRNIAERRRANEERERLQKRLLQSQQIESIGRLAGGVAHDFNNLLSVVLCYAGFAMDKLREFDPLRADIGEIVKAGERASALTHQLLAFSRKQFLEPEVISLNKLVTGMGSMLRRVLGEDVDMEVHLVDGRDSIMADPGQIDQVIMNLALNARDAMPNGGKLLIETANVELDEHYAEEHVGVKPGRYVMLSVTDTGTGMDAATRERVFEPFFTTKEKGKGTGLGLSTVYGVVKQSGGNVWVYSEPERGTTFKVYLPWVDAVATEIARRAAPAVVRGTETVLVVEDEDAVRKIAERILRGAGYSVKTAANGGEALLVCESLGGKIDLLLTDVVMPHVQGRELAERLYEKIPELKVLYMSGYTDSSVAHAGALEPGTRFIGKPFTAADLTRKVREALDAAPAGDGALAAHGRAKGESMPRG